MKKSLLVVLMSMVLGACGSGTSGANWMPGIDYTPEPNKKAVDSIPDPELGELVAVDKSEQFTQQTGEELDFSDLPEGVMTKNVNGKTIRMINLPYSLIAWEKTDNITVDDLVYIRPDDLKKPLFWDSSKTQPTEVPDIGKAVYNGYSAGPEVLGKMKLDVDFGEYTLSGKLYDRRMKDGKRLADIVLEKTRVSTGGYFRAPARMGDKVMGYYAEFAGETAEEVRGFVNDDIGIYEAFGGKRGDIQKPTPMIPVSKDELEPERSITPTPPRPAEPRPQ
ncbi:factor H binding protein domain-containing protein [Bisgaard Taxon 46]